MKNLLYSKIISTVLLAIIVFNWATGYILGQNLNTILFMGFSVFFIYELFYFYQLLKKDKSNF